VNDLKVRKTGRSPDELIFHPWKVNTIKFPFSRRIKFKKLRASRRRVNGQRGILRNAANSQAIRLGKGYKRDKKKNEQNFHVIRLKVEQ